MKTVWLLIPLFFIPLIFNAQKTLTGLWIGTLSNDSTTVRRDQSFEIALTQYKEKVYGYSRATFIVNDTLYYILKRVKGTINGEICEVKDDDIISYNFRGKIDKGVRVTTTFRMNKEDSSWSLAGNWTTNQTKRFYAVTGKVDLKDEPDIEKSKIFPHLEELNLTRDLPFYAEAKKTSVPPATETMNIATIKTKENTTKEKSIVSQSQPKKPETVVVNKPAENNNKPSATIASLPEPKKSEPVAANKPAENNNKPSVTIASLPEPKKSEPVAANKPPENNNKPSATIASLPEPKKSEPVAANKPPEKTNVSKADIITPQTNRQALAASEIKKPAEIPVETKKQDSPAVLVSAESRKTNIPVIMDKPAVAIDAAVEVNERKIATVQQVNFLSDSLQLSLYDNGEIDGDTVSVLMNGEIILAKQGLKATAIKKTIYIQPGDSEFTLVLYAENLGKYAPNTGLLVVYDGEERYQLRFSADLKQNAAIVFRRKR